MRLPNCKVCGVVIDSGPYCPKCANDMSPIYATRDPEDLRAEFLQLGSGRHCGGQTYAQRQAAMKRIEQELKDRGLGPVRRFR